MELGIRGKIALIAASSKGLGRASAEALAAEGAKVVICARGEEELLAARDGIAVKTGAEVEAKSADVTDPTDIKDLVDFTVHRFGGLDILVTNAGGPPPGRFEGFSDEAWLEAWNLNGMSAVRLIRESLPHMRKAGWGRIIAVTSIAVKEPVDSLVLSNSVRASVHGLLGTLSRQVAGDGITCNIVMPGYTHTDRVENLVKRRVEEEGISRDEVFAELAENIPVGRIGMPEEFGAVVAFLASEKSSFVNGAAIPVDGGGIRAAF
jgi:3-oxoacyl-[acyl-carrier protein] reductase